MTIDAIKPQLADYESELLQALGDISGFITLEINDNQLIIHMSGNLSSAERGDVIDVVRDLDFLKNLEDWWAEVHDDNDRLETSDTARRNLEKKVREDVAALVQKSAIGVNDIDHLKLRFTFWTRLARSLWYNLQSTVIKVDADPDKIAWVREALLPLAQEYWLPLKVRWTTIFRAASDEVEIEKKAHGV